MLSPGMFFSHASVGTDYRKPISFRVGYRRSGHRYGRQYLSYNFGVYLKASERVSFSFNPEYSDNFNDAQWVTNIDRDDNGIKDHYVFGELVNKKIDLTLRANMIFNRRASLQFFMQPYITTGQYDNFKELTHAYTYDFNPYTIENNFDFKVSSLKSNLVLRWEYRPGSTLYFVWSRDYREKINNGDFHPVGDLSNLFAQTSNNIVMLKFNYWMTI
jgi:hypothetical protein